MNADELRELSSRAYSLGYWTRRYIDRPQSVDSDDLAGLVADCRALTASFESLLLRSLRPVDPSAAMTVDQIEEAEAAQAAAEASALRALADYMANAAVDLPAGSALARTLRATRASFAELADECDVPVVS